MCVFVYCGSTEAVFPSHRNEASDTSKDGSTKSIGSTFNSSDIAASAGEGGESSSSDEKTGHIQEGYACTGTRHASLCLVV